MKGINNLVPHQLNQKCFLSLSMSCLYSILVLLCGSHPECLRPFKSLTLASLSNFMLPIKSMAKNASIRITVVFFFYYLRFCCSSRCLPTWSLLQRNVSECLVDMAGVQTESGQLRWSETWSPVECRMIKWVNSQMGRKWRVEKL